MVRRPTLSAGVLQLSAHRAGTGDTGMHILQTRRNPQKLRLKAFREK